MTSSALTSMALSGKLSMAIRALGISIFPDNSKSFGEALISILGLIVNFAIDGMSTLNFSACAFKRVRHSLIFFQWASPLRFKRLSSVCTNPFSVELVPAKCNANSLFLISKGNARIFAFSCLSRISPFSVGALRFPPNVRLALSSPLTFSSFAKSWLTIAGLR